MATKPTVKKNTGVFAVTFCCIALLLGYAYYLIQTGQHLQVQALALKSNWYELKPLWARQQVAAGGFSGTVSALLLMMFQGLLYCCLALTLAYSAMKHWPGAGDERRGQSGSTRKDTDVNDTGTNSAEIPGSVLFIALPKYASAGRGDALGGSVDANPYTQDFYRIKQARVSVRGNQEITIYRKLYVALFRMLLAHPDVPASIGGHHADATLFDHSLAVSKKVVAFYAEKGKSEPLAAVAGLAHDMDKLLAYKLDGGKWTKNVKATHHNKYSAYIVSTQPEFRELPEDDRNALVLALRYYHAPENLPLGSSYRTEQLIQALRFCDGYAIQEEKIAGVESLTQEHLQALEKGILDTISELNINGYLSKEGYAGGWTSPALEFALTPMSTLLELIGKHLPGEVTKKLQLDSATRTFAHPAVRLVSERLDNMGLLMTSYKTFESPIGLYDCKIGSQGFRAVLMIQKTVLETLLPGLQEKWGTSVYKVRIKGASTDMKNVGDDEAEGELRSPSS